MTLEFPPRVKLRLKPSDTMIMAWWEFYEETGLTTFKLFEKVAEKCQITQADVANTIYRQYLLDLRNRQQPDSEYELHVKEVQRQRALLNPRPA